MNVENTDCSEDDDMLVMERQLAARSVRASRSLDPTSSTHQRSSPVSERQEWPSVSPRPERSPSHQEWDNNSLPPSRDNSPPSDRSPTPDEPPPPDRVPTAVPDSAPGYLPARKRKRPAATPPQCSPARQSEPSVHVHNRKHVQAPQNLFDDDSPLTQPEDEGAVQPAKRVQKAKGTQPKDMTTRRSARTSR